MFQDPCTWQKACGFQPEGFGPGKVVDRQQGGDDLPGNGSQRRPLHAPSQDKDGHRVEDHVDDAADQGGTHGKLRAAVRTDDGIHGVGKHKKGNTQDQTGEIFPGIFYIVYRCPESCEDTVTKQSEHQCQQDSRHGDQSDGVAHALVGIFRVHAPLADAQVSRAAVTHQKGNGKSDNGDGEYHIGGAVSKESHPAADEDLIHNVIQGGYQQRHDTGDGEAEHQFSDGFLRHILVCVLIHNDLRFS